MGITFIILRFPKSWRHPNSWMFICWKTNQKMNDFGVHPWIGKLQMMMAITMAIVVIIIIMMLIIRMIMKIVYNDY